MTILKEVQKLGSSTLIDPKLFFSLIKKRDKVKRAYYCRNELYADLRDKKVFVKQRNILVYDNPSYPNLVVRLDSLKEIEDRNNNTSYTIWFFDNSYLFLELA